MLYRKVMFDLDGTLIHSMPGIIWALRQMMREMGLAPRDEGYLHNLIGPPFKTGFPRFLDIHGEEIDRALSIYARYAKDLPSMPGMLAPFPGALDMLKALHEAGVFVGIVTSKGATPARSQIERFGFLPYLSHVQTGDDQGNGDKNLLLQSSCDSLGREGLVMVGDRFYDLDAAHLCGVDSIGVLYGYGSEEEIRACRPTHIAHSLEDLQAMLLRA